MIRKSLPIVSFLALAVGCGGHGGNNSSKATTKKVSPSISTEQTPTTEGTGSLEFSYKRKVDLLKDFSNFSEFKEAANEYVGVFKAVSGNYTGAEIKCEKTFFDGVRTSHYAVFNKSGTKAEVKLPLVDSDPVYVEFDCRVSDNGVEIEKKLITLKKSYVVKGIQNPNSLGFGGAKSIEALILDEDSVLQTDGNLLSVNMQQLISNKGKIVTYPVDKDYKPKNDEPGLSSKMINLSAIDAIGRLSFEFRGLQAGAQTKTAPKNADVPPADPRLAGKCDGHDSHANGRTGNKGYQGYKGQQGLSGGDTGYLILRIFNPSDLKLDIQYFPGKGGVGGAGGPGGKGGPGGARAHCASGHMELRSLDGAQGPDGDEGPTGDSGLNGKTETSLIIIGTNDQIEVRENWKNFEDPQQ